MMLIGIYIAVGLCSGLVAGLIGLGGGIVIVPALTAVLTWQHFPTQHLMQVVTGTSLAAIFITMLISIWHQHRRGAIAWKLLKWFIPSMVLGAFNGVWLAKEISTANLKVAFAAFCVIIGLWMLIRAGKPPSEPRFKGLARPLVILLGLGAGTVAGMLGVGGGVMLIPIFLSLGLTMPQSSASAVACAAPTALTGWITAMVLGWGVVQEPYLLGFIHWPAALAIGLASTVSAPFGVYLCHKLPVPVIKRVFGGILLIIAWQMLPSL